MFSSGSQVLYLPRCRYTQLQTQALKKERNLHIRGGDRKHPYRHSLSIHPENGRIALAQQEAQEAGIGLHTGREIVRRQGNSLDSPAFPFHQVFDATLKNMENCAGGAWGGKRGGKGGGGKEEAG